MTTSTLMRAVWGTARGALWGLGAVALGLYGAWSWLRGPRPRLPFRPAEIQRILCIRLDLLGDVVFTVPAIEALAEAFPHARVDALVLPYTAPIAEWVPSVARVHRLDVNRYRRPLGWLAVGGLVRMLAALRREHYDLAIGFSGLMGGVFAVASGARWRLGYANESYRGSYNLPVPGRRYQRPQHEVEYCLDLVRALGLTVGAGQPCLSVPTPNAQPLTPNRPYVVLVPGASNGSAKRWPAPYWSQLGARLANERQLAVVVTGSAAERGLVESVARDLGGEATALAGRTSIAELAEVLAGAALVVAGDTGPLHLAAALGTPVVGIYGPTDPTNTGALSGHSAVLRLGLPCSPCYDLRGPAECKLPDRSVACMWGLTPDRVFEAVCELLERGKGQ